MAAVLAYLDRVDPAAARQARRALWLPDALAGRTGALWLIMP